MTADEARRVDEARAYFGHAPDCRKRRRESAADAP